MALQTTASKAKATAKTRGRPPATPAKQAAAPKAAKPVTAAPKKPAPITSKGAVPKAPLRKAADHIVTFKTVFEKIAEANELSRKRGHAMAAELVDGVVAILKNGGRVRFAGLGTLEVRNRAARMGRNPATGAAIQIAASKKIGFRAAKELKAAI